LNCNLATKEDIKKMKKMMAGKMQLQNSLPKKKIQTGLKLKEM
jgi:hypothetical protein